MIRFSSRRAPDVKARFVYLALLILSIDQLSKYLISSFIQPGDSFLLFPPFLYITLVHNRGAAFGIFPEQTIFFIIVSFLVIIYLVNAAFKARLKNLDAMLLSLVLAGALGNLIDRIRWGYVIDFIDLRFWPVFNIADCAISIGALLWGIRILQKRA